MGSSQGSVNSTLVALAPGLVSTMEYAKGPRTVTICKALENHYSRLTEGRRQRILPSQDFNSAAMKSGNDYLKKLRNLNWSKKFNCSKIFKQFRNKFWPTNSKISPTVKHHHHLGSSNLEKAPWLPNPGTYHHHHSFPSHSHVTVSEVHAVCNSYLISHLSSWLKCIVTWRRSIWLGCWSSWRWLIDAIYLVGWKMGARWRIWLELHYTQVIGRAREKDDVLIECLFLGFRVSLMTNVATSCDIEHGYHRNIDQMVKFETILKVLFRFAGFVRTSSRNIQQSYGLRWGQSRKNRVHLKKK